ncbi:hypothetical protein BTJ68_13836 [Hortaea werneckii EXF-2000]|uniref:NAD-dependent epimerase/dehydratase domain-containing protein n=1 Tax=Hortaea werneckii EXF-2000 TaxID=1157616 RepID=A0A1Z5SWK8_HORWE|nr:hypothetical protein BTJ68_13836 [Hortaea werneckii EXF-2000]
MGSEQYPLRQCGIYRNLPIFDPSFKDLNALVVGATGISGFNTIRSLLESPHRWRTIYAASRNPPSEAMLSLLTNEQRAKIQHVPVDLTGSADDIGASFTKAGVKADQVFFYGYIHPKGRSAMDPATADILMETNVSIFQNFLAALEITNLKPKRILLQTGGKNYGGHIGRARVPYIESGPQPKRLAPNFYYPQEEALFAFCDRHPETDWNIIMPFVLAAVQAEKGEPLHFGGDFEEWQEESCWSSARLTGFLSEWAVLEEKCRNQRFNAVDGCAISMDRLFEELARWYAVQKGVRGPVSDDEADFKTVELAGGENAPLGYGPPSKIRLSSSVVEWTKDEANRQAWKRIMDASRGQLTVDVFESGLDFEMADFGLYRIGQPSVAKLRRFGFNGFVDTMESTFEMFQEMARMGILPAPRVEAARPMI